MSPHLYWIDGPTPEAAQAPGAAEPWGETRVVGGRQPRIDAYERVSGTAVYPSDVILPDMLYAAVARCPHAHARVRSVAVAAAEAMPGVRAVIHAGSPGAALDWPYSRQVSSKLFDVHCRHEGEAVAAVAAETPQQAWDAVRAIAVDYEVLPFLSDERKALDPESAQVVEAGNLVSRPDTYGRGDVAAGFAAAAATVELAFRTEAEIHVPMEMHGCVARWDGDKLTVWESTQGVFPVQQRIAQILDLPLSHVRVIGHWVGGGFGSKLQAGKYDIIAALLARRTARPVKLFLTREETMLCVGNRPPSNVTVKAAASKGGTLTALEMKVLATGGAYPSGGASLIDWQLRDLYQCPNVRSESTDVLTNAGPARAFRAPGHPQGNWALEQALDQLAHDLGVDPVAFRLANVPAVSQAREGKPYTSTGLAACLRDGAQAFGWAAARSRKRDPGPLKRGVGVAACTWVAGGGGPPSTVIVKLFADGSANLNMGASDIGTGTKTWAAMIVAEELGIPLGRIEVEHADTGTTQFATASGGSKTVPTEAPAVRDAALAVRRQVIELAAEELKTPAADLTLKDGTVVSGRDAKVEKKLGDLQGVRRRGVIVGIGVRGPNPAEAVVNPFAAHFAEVEVDTRTGAVRVVRFLAAQDSGRVMNRLTFDNQTFGGVIMGLGFGLSERRILDRGTGRMANRNLHDYQIPTMLDVPVDITCLPIDPHDAQCNSTGAKGLGEPATIPAASAVANAVFDAIGVRILQAPITPARVLAALGSARARG